MESIEQLKSQIAELTAERDFFKRALIQRAGDKCEFPSLEELRANGVEDGPWFAEFLKKVAENSPDAFEVIPLTGGGRKIGAK